ncbi:hypothetical protein PR048_028371 [Dryococelus australis]|uniref:Mitochondrial ribosomal protein L28 n=1 Tax=Dryococelus australis TaxID=614101 RepID=A0ABQ9GIY6_9NEOP|nr:hypothetical protein PR048_028371 [Dryococelus australis]
MQLPARGLRALYVKKKGVFDQGVAARLPEAYRKFWREWKSTTPAAVHYIPEPGKWKRNPNTGVVTRVQNVPLPLKYPAEHNEGLWGGEGVVQGFLKKHPMRSRVPHFWVPLLRRSVVHSEVLDKYMQVTVTDRTITLIHRHSGFDHYLLQTQACDLKSELALKLKRFILLDLKNKSLYPDDPVKREEVYNKYVKYLDDLTFQYIHWHGSPIDRAQDGHIVKEKAIISQWLKRRYRRKYLGSFLEKSQDGCDLFQAVAEEDDTDDKDKDYPTFSVFRPYCDPISNG